MTAWRRDSHRLLTTSCLAVGDASCASLDVHEDDSYTRRASVQRLSHTHTSRVKVRVRVRLTLTHAAPKQPPRYFHAAAGPRVYILYSSESVITCCRLLPVLAFYRSTWTSFFYRTTSRQRGLQRITCTGRPARLRRGVRVACSGAGLAE